MLDGSNILITGGTGSFGKRFIRRVLGRYRPKRLIVYSRDELKQLELATVFPEARYPAMRYFLGDVRDLPRLMRAFDDVDYIVHAAALKHVPAAEYNPFEFVKTNILGAQNVIEAAIERRVKKVVALSTDKAANPINLYGATKLCADKLFIAGNSYSGEGGSVFSVVRYGNVVGSRGSVIPLFMRLREQGMLPITDPRMTRFWLTLDQAVDLVLAALSEALGGEIYVPKIPSMRLVDLAEAVAPGCRREVIGIRPGEKLHETMIGEDDATFTFDAGTHYTVLPAIHNWYADPERKATGLRVPSDFRYTSDTNAAWLGVDDLRRILTDYDLRHNELVARDELDSQPDSLAEWHRLPPEG